MSTIFRNSLGKPFRLTAADLVGGLSILLFLLANQYVSGGASAYVSLLAFVLYGWLFYVVRVAYCWLARKEYPKASDFVRGYVRRMGVAILAVTACIGAFAYYQNSVDPAKLPEYTISNGEKTVRFRAMAHIASESFYAGVKQDIASARKDGYVLYYEGVKPGTPENVKKFDFLMGFKFDKNLYASMSKLYGLVPQKQADIAGTPDPKDKNVDVGIDDIVASYEKRAGKVTVPVETGSGETGGVSATLSEDMAQAADSLNPRQLAVVRYVNRAIMSMVIKNRDAGEAAFAGLGKADLYSSILDDRNKILSEAIVSSDDKEIFVTYGLLHFDGVFDALQEKDHRWKVSGPIRYRFPTLP